MIAECDLLDHFERVVRQREGDWLVTCPTHEDRRPSLHVTWKGDHWELHCFAGCDRDSVLSAARLTFADLGWTSTNGNGRPRIVETYDYVDERGELFYQVLRTDAKDFRVAARTGLAAGSGTSTARAACCIGCRS